MNTEKAEIVTLVGLLAIGIGSFCGGYLCAAGGPVVFGLSSLLLVAAGTGLVAWAFYERR